jgi:hypothetical protein
MNGNFSLSMITWGGLFPKNRKSTSLIFRVSRDVSPSPTPSVDLDFDEELPKEYFLIWKSDFDKQK